MYALAIELDNFIWQIDIYSNLDSIIGLEDILNLVNDLLTLQSDEFQVILAYDTTFQLGDFYVSPILFRHIYFIGSPIIPLAFLEKNQLQIALAREAVQNKRVELIPHMSSFVVQSSNHKTYSVQLNPRETCNCPSTTTCWHIIAANLSVGVLNTTSTK